VVKSRKFRVGSPALETGALKDGFPSREEAKCLAASRPEVSFLSCARMPPTASGLSCRATREDR
jgi:hypothetical protein